MKGYMHHFLLFGLILMFSVTAFAQSQQADKPENPGSQGHGHDDDGPILAGFAIITPLATSTNGGTLTVFATFGMKHGGEYEQAGTLPPGLTTGAVVFVNAS